MRIDARKASKEEIKDFIREVGLNEFGVENHVARKVLCAVREVAYEAGYKEGYRDGVEDCKS